MGAHSQKKKEELQKEKSRCSDLFLIGADQTPPRQQPKFIFSRSDAPRREECTSTVIVQIFTQEKVHVHKTMSSTR
jgi:hypothetical protein